MTTPICVVDAFTDRPFGGNPAAICRLARPTTAAWMQALAAEMNLSETAFLLERGDGAFDLRWFTPAVEVDLCGHATLASAHVLGGAGTFHTRSGALQATATGDRIELDFPAAPPQPCAEPAGLFAALGASGPVSQSSFFTMVELPDAAAVRALDPDPVALALDRAGYEGYVGLEYVPAGNTEDGLDAWLPRAARANR